MDVLRAALGRGELDLLRGVLRHQARRDVRRAVPRPGRPAGPRRRGRRLARPRASSASSRRAGFETALRAYVENCVETDRLLLPRRLRRRGARPDHRVPRRGRRRAAADASATASSPSATPSTASSRRSTTATTGTLPQRRRCRPASTATATTLLALADLYASRGPDGVRRQQRRGDLRDQLPRRPLLGRRRRRCRPGRRLRGGLADLRRGVRLGPGRLPRVQVAGPPSRRSTIDGAGRRPDRGRRHDPRPGHARTRGPRRWPTSSSPAVLVSRDGDGHTGYNAGNDCVDEAVEAYLIDGDRPRGRPHLLTRAQPV